jgi:hypothetical protein
MEIKVTVKIETGSGMKVEVPEKATMPEGALSAGQIANLAEKAARTLLYDFKVLDEKSSPQGILPFDEGAEWTLHEEPEWKAADAALLELLEAWGIEGEDAREKIIEWAKETPDAPEDWIRNVMVARGDSTEIQVQEVIDRYNVILGQLMGFSEPDPEEEQTPPDEDEDKDDD